MAQSVSVNSRGNPSKSWIAKAPDDIITVKFDFGLFFDGSATSHTSSVTGELGIESSALLDNIVTVVISGGENGGTPSLVVSATDGTETKQVSLEIVVDNFLDEATSSGSGSGGGGVPVGGGDTITAFVLVGDTLTITTDQGSWPVDVSGLNQSAHVTRTDNPHSVTKAQVGLGNADNTSDVDKPVSSSQQTALDNKYDASNPDGFTDDQTGSEIAAALFAEADTNNFTDTYKKSLDTFGRGRVVVVNDLSDLPAPNGSGEIELDQPAYFFANTIVSTSPLVAMADVSIQGYGSVLSAFVYAGTGAGIRSQDFSFFMKGIGLGLGSASSMVDIDCAGDASKSVFIAECPFNGNGLGSFGSISNVGAFLLLDTFSLFGATDGLEIGGTVALLGISNSNFVSSVGDSLRIANNATISTYKHSGGLVTTTGTANGILRGTGVTFTDANISSVTFNGAGSALSNLDGKTDVWIDGCLGVENSSITGEMLYDLNATDTVISAVGVDTKVLGATTSGLLERASMAADNRLQNDSGSMIVAKVFCSIAAARIGSGSPEYSFSIYKNGTTPVAYMGIDLAVDPRAVTIITSVELDDGDYVELWVQNVDNTTDLRVIDMNFLMEV